MYTYFIICGKEIGHVQFQLDSIGGSVDHSM